MHLCPNCYQLCHCDGLANDPPWDVIVQAGVDCTHCLDGDKGEVVEPNLEGVPA